MLQLGIRVTALLASLASAAFYGAADFLGGLASRRAATIPIVVISQFAGLIILLAMMPFLPSSSPTQSDWAWGIAAGVAGGVGVALLYHALAMGSMAIVAPITAVCAVTVPVAAAIALGERPGTGTMGGIAVAIAAIVLVSRQPMPEPAGDSAAPASSRGIGTALISGVAIGLFFIALAQSSAGGGMWPLVAARASSFTLFAAAAGFSGRSMRLSPPVLRLAVAGGILDMLANLFFLVATRNGPLSIVVTLSSLYPASTVLLARTVLGERLSWTQTSGIACALVAVILIVATR